MQRDNVFPLASRPAVHAAQGGGGYANTRTALAAFDLSPVRGKRVLLKPNVGRNAGRASGVTTHPDVVAAAIDAFLESGAEVAIGESPIIGVDVMEAYAATGIAEVAAARGCRLIDMDVRRFVELPIPAGQVLRKLKVCPEVFEYDVLVSVPVMKTHMHTVATLSIKNMKGCLWRRSKVELHMLPPLEDNEDKPIDIAIADLSSVLRPHLSIIDGTIGLEGLGPSAGRPKPLDAVVVSAEPFAADAVACELMGLSAYRVPHLRIAAERGYGTIDLDRIDVSPSSWRQWISPFDRPPQNLTIQFPNITVLDDCSCSACQSTLLLFLKRYQDRLFEYFPDQCPIHVAIGKGHTDVPEGTLLVGNCTRHQRDKGIFIPGCPPVGSQIMVALEKQKADATEGGSSADAK